MNRSQSQKDMEQALDAFAKRVPDEAPHTFSGEMRPTFVECDYGQKRLVFSFATESWMQNPGGAVHGGVIAEAISMTVNALSWYFAGQKHNPAISIQLSYPRPALIGKLMYVEAVAIHAGKTMAYVNAKAWQDGKIEKPFAIGTGVHYTAIATEDD